MNENNTKITNLKKRLRKAKVNAEEEQRHEEDKNWRKYRIEKHSYRSVQKREKKYITKTKKIF